MDEAEATKKASEDMARVMAQNPKFRNSEFFDFLSKVSTGELKFENNEVVPGVSRALARRFRARSRAARGVVRALPVP